MQILHIVHDALAVTFPIDFHLLVMLELLLLYLFDHDFTLTRGGDVLKLLVFLVVCTLNCDHVWRCQVILSGGRLLSLRCGELAVLGHGDRVLVQGRFHEELGVFDADRRTAVNVRIFK